MFSDSIQGLLNSSNAKSATERVVQLESMITKYNQPVNTNTSTVTSTGKLPTLNIPSKFSDLMNVKSASNVKFNVLPDLQVSKGYIQKVVEEMSEKYKVDKNLVMAIIKQESGFNPNAVSHAGAQGLMQLMPGTAKKLGVLNPFDVTQNIEGGVKHLRGLMDRYRGNIVLAIAAYNSGGGSVDKYGGVPPYAETQNYVKRILSNYLS
jgi:soluble lytic murein transglycosylase-like protein